MYPNDPTLYGATLPQREAPVPFMNPYLGWQNVMQGFPIQGFPVQGFTQFPWQNLQRIAPLGFPQNYAPIQQGLSPLQSFGVPPYAFQNFGNAFGSYAYNPYVQASTFGLPHYGWQKPWMA